MTVTGAMPVTKRPSVLVTNLWFSRSVRLRGHFLAGGHAPLNVPGLLLVASHNNDLFGCWYLHAKVELMDNCFKLVDQAPIEDG